MSSVAPQTPTQVPSSNHSTHWLAALGFCVSAFVSLFFTQNAYYWLESLGVSMGLNKLLIKVLYWIIPVWVAVPLFPLMTCRYLFLQVPAAILAGVLFAPLISLGVGFGAWFLGFNL
jgi:hypothetical protein